MNDSQKKVIAAADCEVRFDLLTRQLYATDASIYQLVPECVAFPSSARQASSVIIAAAEAGIPITPRGAGTGLSGGAIGTGLVIDLCRYNKSISGLNLKKGIVRVDPGVVLDNLNAFLKPHGMIFGPDVATSSRATLGGMIATNSSGARAPLYGTTVDHVQSLEVILPDGRIETISSSHDTMQEHRKSITKLVDRHEATIRDRFHKDIIKRWPGYGLDKYLDARGDLTKIITGSEGTLAGIISAELKLSPLPREKGLGVIFFASDLEAMEATVELFDLQPVAIEHVDHVAFDQTFGQLAFKPARDLLKLDVEPCRSFLIVEFHVRAKGKLVDLVNRKLGLRTQTFTTESEMELVWGLRKAGLSLLTGCAGPAKPIAGLEDVAIMPEDLPEYIQAFKEMILPLEIEASFYGHAASGLLHVRPILDLHKAEDIAKFRQLAEDISQLTHEFRGSFTGEHGVGIARVEFMEEQVGTELLKVMTEVKKLFDPNNIMNPGKVIPDGRYKIDTNLRQGAGSKIDLPFEPELAFVFKDRSFVGNLEQCNGCGQCKKDEPTMCPTYIATGEEVMSTRGRANIIRAALEHRLDCDNIFGCEYLDSVLSDCLSCKACKTECPSNVNLALLKAELLYAKHKKKGIPLLDKVISSVDRLGKLGCIAPRITNRFLKSDAFRNMMQKWIGISAKRPLPEYTSERFDKWFKNRKHIDMSTRGNVFLWDDCFVRYNEPQIGRAAVAVLEAAGYKVELLEGRQCCGRPAFSRGRLDIARSLGKHNVKILHEQDRTEKVIFLEPSCYSMFAEDYIELGIYGSDIIAKRCVTFEQFIFDMLEDKPFAINFKKSLREVAVHTHCHAKVLTDTSVIESLSKYIPNTTVEMFNSGCCGMAGAFGMLEDKYDLSIEVAKPLIELVNRLNPRTYLVASGTSCRQQIAHLSNARPLHMAEMLAMAIPDKY